jgi:hypothetical protein
VTSQFRLEGVKEDEEKVESLGTGSGGKKYDIKLVQRLINFIEQTMDAKLDGIEGLIRKNNRHMQFIKEDHKKCSSIINSYSKSKETNLISDDIRLYFALAKHNKMDLLGKVKTVKDLNAHLSRSPSRPNDRSRTPEKSRTPQVAIGSNRNGIKTQMRKVI